ncbi:MAG: hypothetical protein LBU18_01425, partial [Treponema sp.]|nr:hypothetical protein [Treponema sp.]
LATVLETKKGETARLFARWLPAAQTIELDKPLERSEGWPLDNEGNPSYRWGYAEATSVEGDEALHKKVFVIYGGNWDDNSPVYVTGRTTDARIRIIPGNGNAWTSERDTYTWKKQNPYEYINFDDIKDERTGAFYGHLNKIPVLYKITPLEQRTRVRVIFVNAKIELDDGQFSPVDLGPYHEFEKLNEQRPESELRFDTSWSRAWKYAETGDVFGAWLGKFGPNNRWLATSSNANNANNAKPQYYVRWNDHEIHAILEFEGQKNVITSTGGVTAFALWNSRYNYGPLYDQDLPPRPNEDGTYHAVWNAYRKECFFFVYKYGLPYSWQHNITYPDDKLDQFNSMGGWKPSVLQLKFRGGAKLVASIRDPANGGAGAKETLDVNTTKGRGEFWDKDEGLKLGSYLWGGGDHYIVGGWDNAVLGGLDANKANVLWGTWR